MNFKQSLQNRMEAKIDNQKPAFRSCWECNAAHEHLKEANGLFKCFECGRGFKNGRQVEIS